MAEDKEKDLKEEEKEETKTKAKSKKKKSSKKTAKKPAKKSAKKEAAKTEDKPVTFTQKPRQVKKHGASKMGVFLVALIVVLIVAGGWYQTQQLTKESQEQASGLRQEVAGEVGRLQEKLQNLTQELEKQKQEKNEPKLRDYQNPDLGVGFSYPEELGDITEQLIEGEAGDSHSLVLTFDANPDIWITAASSKFESDDELVYAGGENLSERCENPLEITEDGFCEHLTVMDQKTVLEIKPIREDSLVTVVKTVPFNVTGGYAGATINVSLGAPPVAGRSIFEKSEDSDGSALDKFMGNLLQNKNLSLVVKENLENSDIIINSLKRL